DRMVSLMTLNLQLRVQEFCARRARSRWNQFAAGCMTAALMVGLLIFSCQEKAFAQQTYCPESISTTQTIERVPEGWKAGQDESSSTLAGITFYSGPPEEKASLVYDRWTKNNGLAYAAWQFQPNSAHRIWLICSYSSTRVFFVKHLPASTSECTVTYDLQVQVSGSPAIRKITC